LLEIIESVNSSLLTSRSKTLASSIPFSFGASQKATVHVALAGPSDSIEIKRDEKDELLPAPPHEAATELFGPNGLNEIGLCRSGSSDEGFVVNELDGKALSPLKDHDNLILEVRGGGEGRPEADAEVGYAAPPKDSSIGGLL